MKGIQKLSLNSIRKSKEKREKENKGQKQKNCVYYISPGQSVIQFENFITRKTRKNTKKPIFQRKNLEKTKKFGKKTKKNKKEKNKGKRQNTGEI